MKKEVFLDLNKVKLYGYEPAKSDKVIESIIKGIFFGDKFPAVDVYEVNPDELLLLRPDGGHCRAIGHDIENQPLRTNVWDSRDEKTIHYNGQPVIDFVKLDWPHRILIGDIALVDDKLMVDNLEHRKRTRKNYR
ncbi:hypothetical protein KY342_05090 [Candidatus Woesearchaeota archaeon]|nr:hypothetical protein [Candidatus Woesearchaeota archaeon]